MLKEEGIKVKLGCFVIDYNWYVVRKKLYVFRI